jgi:hypothetical protein
MTKSMPKAFREFKSFSRKTGEAWRVARLHSLGSSSEYHVEEQDIRKHVPEDKRLSSGIIEKQSGDGHHVTWKKHFAVLARSLSPCVCMSTIPCASDKTLQVLTNENLYFSTQDHPLISNTESHEVDMQGRVMWRGEHKRDFHHRYLVLGRRNLRFYDSDLAFKHGDPCEQKLSIYNLQVEEEAGSSSKGYAFALTDEAKRRVEIACISSSEREQWLSHVKAAIDRVEAQCERDPYLIIDHIPLHQIESVRTEPMSDRHVLGGGELGDGSTLWSSSSALQYLGDSALIIQTLPAGYNGGRMYVYKCSGAAMRAALDRASCLVLMMLLLSC